MTHDKKCMQCKKRRVTLLGVSRPHIKFATGYPYIVISLQIAEKISWKYAGIIACNSNGMHLMNLELEVS